MTEIQLQIDLQDGFVDETVIVCVNGEEIYHREGVQTKFQIGLADHIEVGVAGNAATVEVLLPERSRVGVVELDPERSPYLAVSFLEDAVQLTPSEEPFRYM